MSISLLKDRVAISFTLNPYSLSQCSVMAMPSSPLAFIRATISSEGAPKRGKPQSNVHEAYLEISISYTSKLRRPLLLKSPDPLHPVTGGLNQEIEVGFEP